jgi:hypothetical protein
MFRHAALAAALLACGTSAEAHHSSAMFDQAHTTTLVGTVRQFQWEKPALLHPARRQERAGPRRGMEPRDDAPMHLQRLGWKRTSLKPGDRITVTIHPMRDGSRGGNVLTATGADGKPIGRTA